MDLIHEHDKSLRLIHDGTELLRYVYKPWDAQLESPRPYFHPLRTLAGNEVSLYRPHDHVWHKGIAWSLPNVGPANFWGGPTFLRGGYQQLDNNGSTVHQEFDDIEVTPAQARFTELLEWVTQPRETWFSERRAFTATITPEAWTLTFETSFTNLTDRVIALGSPTTEGRPNAGYGGLFWRGPRSFTGGTARTVNNTGGDDLMGERSPWLSFTGKHDGTDDSSTLVFVDCPTNTNHPTQWFVRNGMFACVCPAPFFDQEVKAHPEQTLTYRYAVVIADGAPDPEPLADLGLRNLAASGPT